MECKVCARTRLLDTETRLVAFVDLYWLEISARPPNEIANQLQALYPPAPTEINASTSHSEMVPPARSLVLIGLSAAFAG